ALFQFYWVYLVIFAQESILSTRVYLACYRNRYNDNRLIKTVEEGIRTKINFSDDELFPRPIILNHLKAIFQPDKNQSRYYTVCGEHRTGKTTLIRLALREVGHGVVYVDVVNDFGEAFDEYWAILIVRALKAFKRTAKAYNVKYDRPMVIVYDNVSRLDPETISILQNDAKDNADS
ncbi:15472_t:CDS:2, partial [Funneliformis geosporum]